MFSHTVGSLFILMLFSLAMQKLFILMRSHFFILSFMSLALRDMSMRMLLHGMSEIFLPMFLWHIICTLYCVFTTPNQVSFHHHLPYTYPPLKEHNRRENSFIIFTSFSQFCVHKLKPRNKAYTSNNFSSAHKMFLHLLHYSHLNLFVLFPISQACPLEAQYYGLVDIFIYRKLNFPVDTFPLKSEGK